ncbi:hypothetical protein AT959_18815 [Dechloromonas denitrificans]|uniref:Uncharacterized protein n=2 Tax=Dechloromonas denitrificans TaxID=281362 RepID=A0A133XE88_9RHOO|nr:hypothetical protein AT959_18815 [Dechloromonas denitrificans]
MPSTFVPTPLICSCGYDLRQYRGPEHSEVWERLAQFSVDALFCKDSVEICGVFFKFFDSQLAERGLENRPELLALLSGIYGEESAKAILTQAPQRSDIYSSAPLALSSKREFRAPQFCAVLVAIDANFEQTRVRITSLAGVMATLHEHGSQSYESAAPRRHPGSVMEARTQTAEIEKHVGRAVTRSYLYRRYKTLFWYLTLFDQAWFEAHYPPGGRGATEVLPSIEADRATIMAAISRAPRPTVRVWKNLSQQAFFRSSLRDADWLDERKKVTARAANAEKLMRKRAYLAACVDDVVQAIRRSEEFSGGPIRISAATLAPYAALSEHQLRHLFNLNPEVLEHALCRISLTPRGCVGISSVTHAELVRESQGE